MKHPLLSIITINFNNASGLKKTMQSVYDLEFTDYEYIIIDGGSNDGSVKVIENFLNQAAFKKKISFWVSESDNGIYDAMNKGLRHANGTFINMMNSGDCFLPNALNTLSTFYKKYPDAILYGACKQTKDGINKGVYGPTDGKHNEGHYLIHQTVFIPKSLHEKYGLYNTKYKYAADNDFILSCWTNNIPFVFIDSIICEFDLSGVSCTKHNETIKELIAIKKKLKIYKPEYKVIKLLLHLFIPNIILIPIKTLFRLMRVGFNKLKKLNFQFTITKIFDFFGAKA